MNINPKPSKGLRLEPIKSESAYSLSKIGTCQDTNIIIPPTHHRKPVICIDRDAFFYCTKVTSITIPKSVNLIGDMAFGECPSLKSVYITDIEAWCNISFRGNNSNPCCNGADLYLNGEKVTELVIPDTVTALHDNGFKGCTSLTSVTIPVSVTSIGWDTFSGCSGLTRITYGGTMAQWEALVKDKKWSAGTGKYVVVCSDGTIEKTSEGLEISFNSGGKSYSVVGRGRCADKDVVLPTVYQGKPVTSIRNMAFEHDNMESITIPESITDIGQSIFSWCSSLKSITVDKNNPFYHSAGNCLIETESKILVTGCQTSIIPDDGSVTSIDHYAFARCTALTSITIPDSIEYVGGMVFYNCTSLTTVSIGEGVKSIWKDAFCGCDSLTDIYYSGTPEQFYKIAMYAGIPQNTNIHFPDEKCCTMGELMQHFDIGEEIR